LIGEHVDYTGGFVLPLAIEFSTVCYGTGKRIPESRVELHVVSSVDPSCVAKLSLEVDRSSSKQSLPITTEPKLSWTNYIVGVIAQYVENFEDGLELSLAISSNVPLGGGLSSSASLEVAVAHWLEQLLGCKADPIQRALKCQTAEHVYANTPCGIMDQFISSAAIHNSLLLIDCESNTFEPVSIPSDSLDVAFVVTNSLVKHDNAGGEYPVRVQQCKEALSLINAVAASPALNLRHVTQEMLDAAIPDRSSVLYKRAHHAVTENARVLECRDALTQGYWTTVGHCMIESHRSMQYDYETSCEEINFLVDSALQVEGVYGSRLTGGGFGGCIVSLVEKSRARELMDFLRERYQDKYSRECISFQTTPSQGARAINL